MWNISYCSSRIIHIKLDDSFSFLLVIFSDSIWFISLKIMHSCLTSSVPKIKVATKISKIIFLTANAHTNNNMQNQLCNRSRKWSFQCKQNKLVLYCKTNWRPNCYLLPKQKSMYCLHIKNLSGSIILQISQYQMFN